MAICIILRPYCINSVEDALAVSTTIIINDCNAKVNICFYITFT